MVARLAHARYVWQPRLHAPCMLAVAVCDWPSDPPGCQMTAGIYMRRSAHRTERSLTCGMTVLRSSSEGRPRGLWRLPCMPLYHCQSTHSTTHVQ